MKSISANLLAHYQQGTTTLAHGLKITRLDGAVFAFTSAQEDVVIGGVRHGASQGLMVTNIEQQSGAAVDNLELSTLDDGTLFVKADILAGVWNNARFELYRYNVNAPADGTDPLLYGTVGNVRLGGNVITAELRGLQQYFQQPVGDVTSRNCRARFGDSMCRANAAAYTVTGTITSVTNKQTFADSALTQADDWFAEGLLTFTSGNNIGITQKVKTFASKAFTLSLPMLQTIQVGDTYSVVAGCRKRLAEDCVAKFNNAINFQGEPHVPGIDKLSRND